MRKLDLHVQYPCFRFSEAELRDWFEKFDQDNDGYVNKSDIRKTMEDRGLTILSPQIEELMRYDRTGKFEKLSFEDFCRAISKL